MKPTRSTSVAGILLAVGFAIFAGCDRLSLPRLTHSKEATQRLPVTVKLEFDEALQTATIEETVCADSLWEGQLGRSIVSAFEKEGQRRFIGVIVGSPGRSLPGDVQPQLTVTVRLLGTAFEPTTRTGSSENFNARLAVQLASTYRDAQGQTLTEGPLTYSDNVSLWTPTVGSGGSQCMTNQLDAAVDKASAVLAEQMSGVVASMMAQAAASSTTAPSARTAQVGRQARQAFTTSTGVGLSIKATLLDDNNNQVLEPGERVSLRIDTTNTSATSIGVVSISLSGTPTAVQALAQALSGSPVMIGPIPPGDTRSAIIAGKMPMQIDEDRAELTLSATLDGTAVESPVTVIAAVRPTSAGPSAASQSQASKSTRTTTRPVAGFDNRYAIIVGVEQYRAPWPGLRSKEGRRLDDILALFQQHLGVPNEHILLLQDELAARADIEESLTRWLPNRVTADSVVFFYFAGQAVSDAKSGEVSLLPYDGAPTSSSFRWLSLRSLQARLRTVSGRLAIAMLDAPVTVVPAARATRPSRSDAAAVNWAGELADNTGPNGSKPVIQVSSMDPQSGLADGVLEALRGTADVDRDGHVSLSEWLRSVRGRALTFPTLPPSPMILTIPISAAQP